MGTRDKVDWRLLVKLNSERQSLIQEDKQKHKRKTNSVSVISNIQTGTRHKQKRPGELIKALFSIEEVIL